MAFGFLAWGVKELFTGRAKRKKAVRFVSRAARVEPEVVERPSTPSEKFVGGPVSVPSSSVSFRGGTQQRGSGKIDFQALNIQLDNIRNATDGLVSITEVNLRLKKRDIRAEKIFRSKNEKKKLEKKSEAGGFWAKRLVPASKGIDDIFQKFLNFIGNVGMGAFLLWVLNNADKIKKTLSLINTGNFKLLFRGLQGSIKSIGWTAKAALKGTWGLITKGLSVIKNGLGKVATTIGRSLKTLGNSVFGFALRRLKQLRNVIRSAPGGARLLRGVGGGTRSGGSLRGKDVQRLRSLQGVQRLRSTSFIPKSQTLKSLEKGVAPSVRMSKPITTSGGAIVRQSQILGGSVARAPQLGSGLGTARNVGNVGAAKHASKLKFFKGKFRIPIIGPLITAIVSQLEGDELDQTAWKTGGALLGGLIGGAIGMAGGPASFIGLVVGEVIGEYLGDVIWMLMTPGQGVSAVKAKLKGTWDIIMSLGSKLWDTTKGIISWIGDSVKKIWDMVPKVKMFGKDTNIPNYFKLYQNLAQYIMEALFGIKKDVGVKPDDAVALNEGGKGEKEPFKEAILSEEYTQWLKSNNLLHNQQSYSKYLQYKGGDYFKKDKVIKASPGGSDGSPGGNDRDQVASNQLNQQELVALAKRVASRSVGGGAANAGTIDGSDIAAVRKQIAENIATIDKAAKAEAQGQNVIIVEGGDQQSNRAAAVAANQGNPVDFIGPLHDVATGNWGVIADLIRFGTFFSSVGGGL